MAQTKTAVKYLRVVLDTKLSLEEYIQWATDKAVKMISPLCKVVISVGRPRPGIRRMLLRVAESVILYGADVWANALPYEMYRKRMAAV